MQIFNTMTRQKEELVPKVPGKISMYVCGPTVYNLFHIGNARPFIVFDTLRRFLEYKGFEVTFVQNFTDIDDKVIKKANEENSTYREIADRYINEYYKDADSLGIKRATANPRATEHIDSIISLVQLLIDNGHAYPTPDGDVYFSVRSFKDYGKLSGQSIDDLESGARINPGEQKLDPLDFALWKGSKPGEPAWQSPWGPGRPGWHIECSAMSMSILGETFDIHCGGQDLVFPHHENEIAQSEAATGKPFARYWMHNGFININNQKMSKSLNNFFLVRDITNSYDPRAVRLFMLGAHYRNPVNFSDELMEQAQSALTRLITAKERIEDAKTNALPYTALNDEEFIRSVKSYKEAFIAAMDDDLNTADALGVLFDFARASNVFVTERCGIDAVNKASSFFDELSGVLGLDLGRKDTVYPKEALMILAERTAARMEKDFKRADELREKLKSMGFAVEDGKDGARLKPL
ncbi:MAG: Cysteine--tRNA ligase [Firmicutes bacterium ADurb.Bin182]|nr:MAG: Cysteine--tRNA ligase [Firmicutes bacterium ADurb.Bin182]